ncbi:MAG: restriction endonuclease, partial [Firmicutes bacterium]|nr:restriction endonuclease [Bacillota bacterium]
IVFADDPEKAFAQSSEKNWLSPDEFKNLSSVEKSQLALDRWKSRSKTKWEIGIEYEQYIGYILESNEYRVEYQGAKLGLEDMGIDLIAEKNGITWLIQCKRWNEKKTIHEKHIFQLYGSKVLYELQHPEKQVFARFVTAEDNLSELAKQCADKLNVIVDVKPHKEYPLIKCNINNGQKIYHLPMDQQYHNVIIDRSKKEKYVWTAKEAEEEGFQRAKKHLF